LIKYILLTLFCVCNILLSQERPKPVFIEHNSIMNDSQQVEIFSYRIPYKNLLFTKESDNYTSSFALTLEFYRDEEFIKRDIVNPTLSTKDYEKTLSGEYNYQDIILMNIDPGDYILKPTLSLGSTDLEYAMPSQKIIVDNLSKNKIIGPLIVSDVSDQLKNYFELSNYGNTIPFSHKKYSLLYGLADSTLDSVNVTIKQLEKLIFSGEFPFVLGGNISVDKNEESIQISVDGQSEFRYFIISGFSNLLYEGKAELLIAIDGSEKKYDLNIHWIEKPKILNNPEYSIKLLSYIEKENVVGDLLSSNEDDYYKNLTEYWVKNFPADGMKYNYAMKEYYNRADHSIKNYSSLNSFDGAERDRGKIYILYGNPTTMERNYTEMNEIIEIWNYENLAKTFIFKDVNGTGKFDLTD